MADIYSEKTRNSLEEIGRLLDLAEEVHRNLLSQRSAIERMVYSSGMALAIATLALTIFASSNKEYLSIFRDQPLIFLSMAVFFVVGYVFALIKSVNLQRHSRIERDILYNILEMVSVELSLIEHLLKPLDLALIRMRTRRLSLSKNVFSIGIGSIARK